MEYKGYRIIELSDNELSDIYLNKNLEDYLENEYLVITQDGKIVDKRVYQNGETRSLRAFEIGDTYTDIWKPKNIEQSLAFDLVEDETVPVKLLTGRYGSGKAQPVDTMVPTPNGWKKLGKLKVGDEVFDRLGKPTKILEIFPQGKKDNYKITFSDGRVSYCNNEHIWGCYDSEGVIKSFTVKDMLEKGLKEEDEYNFKIPSCKPVQYPTKKLPIAPYVMGVAIANGIELGDEGKVFCKDEVLIRQLAIHLNCSYEKAGENTWRFAEKEPFKDIYGRLKPSYLSKDHPYFTKIKYYLENNELPDDYLIGDAWQRLSFLMGILDSLTIEELSENQFILHLPNIKMVDDVKKLMYGLGYDVMANQEDNLSIFVLHPSIDNLFITDIKKMSKQVDMVCILVDNDEHLYLTNDYIVTHNTGILCKAGISAVRKGKFDKLLWVRNNIEVKDTAPLGSLPGDLLQKMWWTAGPLIDHCGGEYGLERLIEEGQVEIAYLGHLRGRDIRNSLIICSEAENLTKQHIQLLLGRVGDGSNLWLDADLRQRDKKVFEDTAGIEKMIEKLKGNPLFGYIHLEKTERSKTACLADLLDE